jgi:hypothetical protein
MVFHWQKSILKKHGFCHLCQDLFGMPAVKKYFDSRAKRATIELWRAKNPQRAIMK